MTEATPRVTVIIATWNWATVLPYSIGSVLDQTFTDFELLVIGDGCTDESESVVTAIADPRVRWINIPRVGMQAGPNNEGIRQARGTYIAYLNHDDLWMPHHLEVLVRALDDGADLAHSVLAMIGVDAPTMAWTLPPSSVVHRRSMIDAVGGWRDYRELAKVPEVDLWDRARTAGLRFTFVRRLTAIKFPAAWRRDVYVERPCHEQAAWLERIRSEPDLEAHLLVDMVFDAAKPPPKMRRIIRLLFSPWRWRQRLVWEFRSRRKGATVRHYLRTKGVR